jgi:hypothetical protein
MSLEMAHKVIVPPKKNYIPQFLKQRDINSYYTVQHLDLIKEKLGFPPSCHFGEVAWPCCS